MVDLGGALRRRMLHATLRRMQPVLRRDLQQLYQQLVVRGVLSEEEFWRGRQSLLKQRMLAGAAQKQRKGFDNAMISELADGGGNKVLLCVSTANNDMHMQHG
jgi:hypothetical protein